MQPFEIWLTAVRPKTLSLSVSPVVVGTVLAWVEREQLLLLPAIAALLAAMLIQAGTNLHNDATDGEKGADTADRLGPPRATAQGWLSARQVKRGAAVSFGCAFLLGVYLVAIGGWPILILGIASLLARAAYSSGPWPLSASPLGELFVALVFGLAAVCGSYYLQAGELQANAWLAGGSLGLFAAAVLVVNNYRDRVSDRRAGRKTLAVLMTPAFSQYEYVLLMILPFVLLLFVDAVMHVPRLPLLLLPMALYLAYQMMTSKPSRELNSLLARTAAFQLLFAAFLVAGLLI